MKETLTLLGTLLALSISVQGADISADNATVDNTSSNTGTGSHWLNFGNGSGEGIGSKRTAGSGQYGLDFYTYYATRRMHIGLGGGVNIGSDLTDYGPGFLQLNGEVINPFAGSLGLRISQDTGTGNYSTNGYSGNLNLIDVADSGALGSTNFGIALGIQMTLNSGNAKGNRNVLQSILQFQHASDTYANGNARYPNYVAGYFGVGPSSGDNGTDTNLNSRGSFFALNPDAVAHSGATNLTQLAGMEIDYEAQSGSSVRWKSGLIVNQKGSDVVQGRYDNAISICRGAAVSATQGLKVGIEFGYGDGGGDPMSTGGTLIKATSSSNPTVATGIDFFDYNVTGNLIQGKYSALTDYGGVFIGAGPSYSTTNIAAQGGQANIDIKMSPKGTGLVQVGNSGSFTTGSHSAVAKWLKVKDDAGNVYYMPLYQ